MRDWMLIMTLVLVTGCGLFASGAAMPVALNALDHLAGLVKERTGKRLQDVPMTCEHENDPESGKLLMLCTVCYTLEAGETCK